MLVTDDGTLWATTRTGLSRMSLSEPGVFRNYYSDPDNPASLSHDFTIALTMDAAGTLWIGTAHGLNRLDDVDSGRFSRFAMDPDPEACAYGPPGWSTALWGLERPEEPGIIWFGSDKGLIRMDASTSEWERIMPDSDDGCAAMVGAAQDPVNPGVLWASHDNGLARFDIRTSTFTTYRHDPDDASSLQPGWISKVTVDRGGMIWVGSRHGGLSRFDPTSVGLAQYRYVPNNKQGLGNPAVYGIHQSRDGVVWVGGAGSEGWILTGLDRERGRATHYRARQSTAGIGRGPYWNVMEDRSGAILVSGRDGLSRLDRSTGRFTLFKPDPDSETALWGDVIAIFGEDQLGNVWIGGEDVVYRMDPAQPGVFKRFLHDPEDEATIVGGMSQSITEDLAGFMWIASVQGLSRLDPKTGRTTRYQHDPDDPESLTNLHINYAAERSSEPGIIWATTYGGGLNRLEVATGEVRHFTVEDGLPNNGLYGFVEDDDGNLWITTNRGISRFDPDTETFRNFGMEVGLQSLEFNSYGFHRGPTGEMFFGGVNGMNSFFPNELRDNTRTPDVALVDFKLFNQSMVGAGLPGLDGLVADAREVVLDYSQNDIELDFVALHYTDPEQNEYAYLLEGWNDDWVHIGNKRTASFTNLDPGEYTFRVRAANADGFWNEDGASLRLVVKPPFWATWWFRLLALLAIGGVIAGGYRLRTRQLETRAAKLEGLVGERTAELKESNEQLVQSATIVEAINKETSFRRLLTKILEEARVMPGVEKATAIILMPEDGQFHVRASSGWDVEAMTGIRLSPQQAEARYVKQAEEVADNIFVAKDVADRAATDEMAEFGEVASFMVLRVVVEDEVVAYLIFDNLNDKDAFDRRDIELLQRLQKHITSAFIKARILEDVESQRADLQQALDSLRSTQDRLVQSEKMASLGQLTAGIAHEIRNPLNFVNNFSDMSAELAEDMEKELDARRSELPEDLIASFQDMIEAMKVNASKIHQHGERAEGIVQNMLEHSKGGEGERHPTDLNNLLDEYATLAHHGLRSRDTEVEIALERKFDPDVGKVDLIPQEIGRVVMNLIGNAFDALIEHGANGAEPQVVISTSKNGSGVEIRITDNGPGIPDSVKARIFEPFFTTKPTGSGTGLGLSMAYDIVTKGHGGQLELASEDGQGATFVVTLPA